MRIPRSIEDSRTILVGGGILQLLPSFWLENRMVKSELGILTLYYIFKTSSSQRCMGSAVNSGAVVFIGGGCVHRCSK